MIRDFFNIVPCCVAGQLQDLGGEVLHHRGHVDRGAGADPLRVVDLPAGAEIQGQMQGRRCRDGDAGTEMQGQ
jgi:hypothetical protein